MHEVGGGALLAIEVVLLAIDLVNSLLRLLHVSRELAIVPRDGVDEAFRHGPHTTTNVSPYLSPLVHSRGLDGHRPYSTDMRW